jgi:hypothetical protein
LSKTLNKLKQKYVIMSWKYKYWCRTTVHYGMMLMQLSSLNGHTICFDTYNNHGHCTATTVYPWSYYIWIMFLDSISWSGTCSDIIYLRLNLSHSPLLHFSSITAPSCWCNSFLNINPHYYTAQYVLLQL